MVAEEDSRCGIKGDAEETEGVETSAAVGSAEERAVGAAVCSEVKDAGEGVPRGIEGDGEDVSAEKVGAGVVVHAALETTAATDGAVRIEGAAGTAECADEESTGEGIQGSAA